MKLYKFQQDYLVDLPARAIMAADTGTGKTVMAIYHYIRHAYPMPLLIAAPASKVRTGDWERELAAVFKYIGQAMPQVSIISYERLARFGQKYPNWFEFTPVH